MTESEFCDVEQRCRQLGLICPGAVAILPRNFEDAATAADLLHESSTLDVRKILRDAGIDEQPLELDANSATYAQENDATWVGPTLFFAAGALSENPQLLSVTYDVISNYLTDFFKGVVGNRTVRIQTVLEKTKTKKYAEFTYEGDPDGLVLRQSRILG